MQTIGSLLRGLPGKYVMLAAGLLPLMAISTPASAGDIKLFISSGHGGHGYHHNYRTRPGFALSYGSGGHYRGKHYRHYKAPKSHYYGKSYGYRKAYPSGHYYGHSGYGRSHSYYHDRAKRYSYKHGYRHGYRDGRYDERRRTRHGVGGF
ncbi:hypothetical protein J2T55_000611 [Methylohalomonas lacus]|uniref:Uncharacterized protein n=1 Tax=Methylohalomonas lacus TaxID=398773 RepID=A0AAE3L538_9GAMM|nr:hypothetical protein [Methylohalomonas lacus]MCS3902607.1 hypothetical protein [Methylohalomonas lacus]